MKRGLTRGQATTELALGSIVFVTVLLFGIHFAEAGYAMMKAKEAAAFAMHEASGSRTHMFDLNGVNGGNTFQPFDPPAAGAKARARYGVRWAGVLTGAGPLRVECRADNTLTFGLQSPGGLGAGPASAFAYLRGIDEQRGGVACEAEGTMSLFGVPEHLADEGGGKLFKAPNAKYTSIPVCGAGMPKNGKCEGKLTVLTGDWAFEGPMGHEVNDDVVLAWKSTNVRNRPYEAVVHELFNRAGGQYSETSAETPAQKMMRIVGGLNKGAGPEWFNETAFNMSYKGERGAGVNVQRRLVDSSYNSNLEYQTTGADMDNPLVQWNDNNGDVNGVPRCFMGLYGCANYLRNPR